MKKRKGLFAVVIVFVVLVVDLYLFGPQILAVIQETSRGFHLDVHGVRFHTPMFYTSSTGDAYDVYHFVTVPSPTRHKNSKITVDFKKQPPALDQPLSQEGMTYLGLRLIGERTATLAGRSGSCLEYETPVQFVQINCRFASDLHARFFGSPNTVEEFYTFMNRAEVLSRNN